MVNVAQGLGNDEKGESKTHTKVVVAGLNTGKAALSPLGGHCEELRYKGWLCNGC
jgi:hypothetical protein